MAHLPMSRRRLLKRAMMVGGGLGAAGLRAFAETVGSADGPAKVRTALGMLRGEVFAGGKVFRGVPYAAPPLDTLRFRPPAIPQPWTGERDATRFAAAAVQSGENGVEHSEDCLYLNVWTPEEKGPHPVFVWIHGGGFTGGHSFEPLYDGAMLAREGIVCVTVGYRLGVFGFLDLEPMLGADYAGSANNGLRDLIAALTWIQAHVSDFGGDPNRVTVGGESAGAKLTDILMGVPSATALFHQMVSESGGAERVWPRTTAETVGNGFAEVWRKLSGRDSLGLRTADVAVLIKAQQLFLEEWSQHFPLRPQVDDALIKQLPIHTIAAGATRGKRLLIGTNRDESALFVGPHPQHDATAADLGNLSQATFLPTFAHYAQLYPNLTAEQRRIRALTAEEYWIPSTRVADAHVTAGGHAWMYRLDFAESKGRLAGFAYHSLDTGLVWDKPHIDVGNDAQESSLAVQMHLAWSAFILGSAPAAPGLPLWPEYRSDSRPTMILNTASIVEQQPQQAELELWKGLL